MTTEVADRVSEALVEEAIAHLDSYLSNATWLRDNRKFNGLCAEYSHWYIRGVGHLTVGELDRVTLAYADKGWRHVRMDFKFHDELTNWTGYFQTNP